MYLRSISVFWIVFFGFTFCSKAGFLDLNNMDEAVNYLITRFNRFGEDKKLISPKNNNMDFDSFSQVIARNPRFPIERLIFTDEKLYPDQLGTLLTWLSTNNTLKSLSLLRCGLTGHNYPEPKDSHFINGFKRWLEFNKIELPRNANGKSEQTFLKTCVNRYINVWKDSHAGFLLGLKKWLESNTSLEELNLSGNPLKYSVALITESLAKNRGLKRLMLDNIYPVNDMWSETFESDLSSNTTLEYFSFCNNKLKNAKELVAPVFNRQSPLPAIQVDLTGTEITRRW